MTYRSALLVRWSRRDRLAAVVVATITALVVGSVLVAVGIGAETTDIAAQLDSSGTVTLFDDPAAARSAARPDSVVVPTTTATTAGGTTLTVLGAPEAGSAMTANESIEVSLPQAPGDGAVAIQPGRIPDSRNASLSLSGPSGSVTRTVVERTRTDLFPPGWAVASSETVAELGATGAVVVTPATEAGVQNLAGPPPNEVPFTSALAFFVAGTDQLVRALSAVIAGAGLLVAIVVFSVTRMSVRDRLTTIAVLRATGLPRYQLLALFGARAGLLTAIAVAGGAAAGLVFTNAAVNVAVFAGVPTTLTLRVTPAVAAVVGPWLVVLVVVGALAGAAAAISTVRQPPARVDARARGGRPVADDDGLLGRIRSRVGPQLLPAGAVVPTALTLAVFVAVAILAATTIGTLAPLQSPGDATILEAGTDHPWVSRVDADYARALRAEGVAASGEILAFSVVDGDPFLTRGAEFGAFANLSDGRLVDGRRPRGPDEAVVGRDLSGTLGLEVGDVLPLGGSDNEGFATVTVVGRYRAPGVLDDQLVVPLATARHLSNVGPGEVNFVRVDRRPADGTTEAGETRSPTDPDAGDSDSGLAVVDLVAPPTVSANESIVVTATVTNEGGQRASSELTARIGNETRSREVSVEPGAVRNVSLTFDARSPGSYTVSVADRSRTVRVIGPRSLRLPSLPERGPPNATVLVRVIGEDGKPVANATVSTGNGSAVTDSNGRTAVRLPANGTATIVATAPGYGRATHEIELAAGATRGFVGRLTVTPTRVSVFERPTARLTLTNPWDAALTRRVVFPNDETRRVSLRSVETRTFTSTLPRTGSGVQQVRATVGTRVVDTATYRVEGDDRLVAAVATSDRHETAGSSVGRAASHLLGNLWVVFATLVALAAVATLATTTAAFARTVHARRETIGIRRATGGTRSQVLRVVLVDAVKIAVPSTFLALGLGYVGTWLLAAVGLATAFGVTLYPSPAPGILAAIAVVAVGLALAGATAATLGMLFASPADLLSGTPTQSRGGEADDA